MMTSRTHALRVLVACLISGLMAGLLAAWQCGRAGSDCRIAAVAAFSPDPVAWTLWFHWINWLPGFVFGLFFALAAVDWSPYYGRRILLYALASAVAYLTAGVVFSVFLDVAGGDEFALIIWLWPAGLSAGLMGTLLLSLAASKLLPPSGSPARLLRGTPLPAAVGALAGVLFVFICSYGEQHAYLAFPVAFVFWQVTVGQVLQSRISPERRAQDMAA